MFRFWFLSATNVGERDGTNPEVPKAHSDLGRGVPSTLKHWKPF
jgi:hypothetical protein